MIEMNVQFLLEDIFSTSFIVRQGLLQVISDLTPNQAKLMKSRNAERLKRISFSSNEIANKLKRKLQKMANLNETPQPKPDPLKTLFTLRLWIESKSKTWTNHHSAGVSQSADFTVRPRDSNFISDLTIKTTDHRHNFVLFLYNKIS